MTLMLVLISQRIWRSRFIRTANDRALTQLDFDKFVEEYRRKFIISDSILSRLTKRDYGIINSRGSFRTPYMYYFFLGRFMARESAQYKGLVEQMCEMSHVSSNYLTLLFIIHHTNDNGIIDDILIRTMCTLDKVRPAKLNRDETVRFQGTCSCASEKCNV